MASTERYGSYFLGRFWFLTNFHLNDGHVFHVVIYQAIQVQMYFILKVWYVKSRTHCRKDWNDNDINAPWNHKFCKQRHLSLSAELTEQSLRFLIAGNSQLSSNNWYSFVIQKTNSARQESTRKSDAIFLKMENNELWHGDLQAEV